MLRLNVSILKKIVKNIAPLFLVAMLTALVVLNFKGNARSTNPVALAQRQADNWNTHITDSAVSLLRSGCVVLRMGLGADSRILAQLNRKDKRYSHCGIVMVEHGYPFVYHSIGGEDNPDERMRRDSAKLFFSPRHNTAIAIVKYDLDPVQTNKLKNVVASYYNARPKFDMQFDLNTDDKLYCAELVYKAINKVANSAYIPVTRMLGRTCVGVDDLFLNSHARFIFQTKFK